MVKHFLTYVMTLFCLSVLSQNNDVAKKSKIEILSADELIYNQEVGRYQICRGNVRFKQGNMLMDCDSARFYEDVNKIEAFGDIYIRQKRYTRLVGKVLRI